jgi:hypothetical protein
VPETYIFLILLSNFNFQPILKTLNAFLASFYHLFFQNSKWWHHFSSEECSGEEFSGEECSANRLNRYIS